jgi:hypothetical protein
MQNRRVCYIEVETNGKLMKKLDGLAIKGRVSRKMGSVFSEARLSVANLTKDDVEFLTTYTSPYMNPSVRKKINIYAGYENTGYGQIFTGEIYKALPNGMPDTWLDIEAKSLYYEQRTPLSYGVNNITTKELAQSVATQLNLTLDWLASEVKTLDSFNFAGSQAELIKEFNQLTDAMMFEDNGILKVVDRASKTTNGKIKLINVHTGMIGLPEPDQFGIKVKCLLDPSLSCGSWIKVESIKLPALNGQYQIYTLDFDFANRESAFYCDIYAKGTEVL